MKILQINASARTAGSISTRIADAIVARLRARTPEAALERRDLAAHPHSALDDAALGALFTPADQRTAQQAARVAMDQALIDQLMAADVIVLGVPMYNFGVSVQFKTWIDAVAKAGLTFRYTENGPEGLVTGKKVYIALARGGVYRDTSADSQVPYLKTVLGFMGLTDLTFIYAEGLAMGAESADRAITGAMDDIERLIP